MPVTQAGQAPCWGLYCCCNRAGRQPRLRGHSRQFESFPEPVAIQIQEGKVSPLSCWDQQHSAQHLLQLHGCKGVTGAQVTDAAGLSSCHSATKWMCLEWGPSKWALQAQLWGRGVLT